jgi:Cu(I)-responsive transcriptional regulator
MHIGEAAARSGISAKMIRYYEQTGLLAAPDRRANGYRDYDQAAVAALCFVRRARDLGFAVADTGALLALWQDRARASRDVKRLAEGHIAALEQRMAAIADMADTLRGLVEACPGNDGSRCPILEDLAPGSRFTRS